MLPLEEQERQNCVEDVSELVEWLDNLNRDEADEFSKFLHKNLADLLNVPEDRNLIEVLRKHSVEAVFARSKTEQEKLRAYLSHHNILNVETCILSAME